MVVRRSSTVVAEARAAARERRGVVAAARREREQKIEELSDAHAVAVAMAQEIQARADREIAGQMAKADGAIVELLDLGERAGAVAELLGVTVAEVRAARRRARGAAGESDAADEDAGAGADGEPAGAADTARGTGKRGGTAEAAGGGKPVESAAA